MICTLIVGIRLVVQNARCEQPRFLVKRKLGRLGIGERVFEQIQNQEYILKIISKAQEIGGVYWYMDQSEDNNIEVRLAFMELVPDFHIKRVYDCKDCYLELLIHLEKNRINPIA